MIRLFACGLVAVVLVIYLSAIGLSHSDIGVLLMLLMLGDALISLYLSTRADRFGRRGTLLIGAVFMFIGGAGMVIFKDFVPLLICATIGVVSPTGAEVGPFLAVEQAALAQIVPSAERTKVFAQYHVAGFVSSAAGALVGGWAAHSLQESTTLHYSDVQSYQLLLGIFSACGVLIGVISRLLSTDVEITEEERVTAKKEESTAGFLTLGESQSVVLKLSVLFAVDSFAGGFTMTSFIAFFLKVKFDATDATLGRIFFVVQILAGVSAIAAVPLATRIGLIRTMVFTHIPASFFLIAVPFMPSLQLATLCLWARSSVMSMDVPTRQAFVTAIVPSHVRSAANGVTSTAKQGGRALAPLLAAPLLGSVDYGYVPFVVAGTLKIMYDLTLFQQFKSHHVPD